jgi:hypothetical protein
MHRPAYGYVSLPRQHPPDAEVRLRRCVAEFAVLQDLDLHTIFVDKRESQPYGFAALLTVMGRTGVRLVVLPDLTHVEHIATVSAFSQAGLGRFLDADVLLTTPSPAVPAQSRPADEPRAGSARSA